MPTIQDLIRQNEAAVIAAVLEALPSRFMQVNIVPKDKETEMLEKEAEWEGERQEIEIIDPEKQIEIANGEIEVKETAGAKSGGVTARIIGEVGVFAKLNKLGRVYTPDTTFMMGDNQRMPDMSFVAAARIPATGEPLGKWDFAPDLCVEVISPSDPATKIRRRLTEFFAAGVGEIWIVEPEPGILSVYHQPLKPTAILTKDDELTSEKVLPGFRLQLNEIFID